MNIGDTNKEIIDKLSKMPKEEASKLASEIVRKRSENDVQMVQEFINELTPELFVDALLISTIAQLIKCTYTDIAAVMTSKGKEPINNINMLVPSVNIISRHLHKIAESIEGEASNAKSVIEKLSKESSHD